MPFPKKESEELLARTGRRCCICDTLHSVQLHHIVPKADGGDDQIENAIPLCPNCHDEVHGSRASGRSTKAYTPDELKLHLARTIQHVQMAGLQDEQIRESIDRQFRDLRRMLAEFVAGFDLHRPQAATVKNIPTPKDADGLFVVPKPSSVAAKLGIDDPFGGGYGQLLEATVFSFLAKQPAFRNWRAGELTPHRVRMRESTANTILELEEETPGDFLVFPAQTGKKYAGYSVRNARWEMEHGDKEIPLPAWCVANILLTNPDRFEEGARWLGIDCPGDECRAAGGKQFDRVLHFAFDGETLHLNDRRNDRPDGRFGSASGWVLLPRLGPKDPR